MDTHKPSYGYMWEGNKHNDILHNKFTTDSYINNV